MNVNYAILCRLCGKEKETISHVIGSCPRNNTIVTISRHNKIKNKITEELKKKGLDCFEEVHAIDLNGSNRFCDIVELDKRAVKISNANTDSKAPFLYG